MKNEFSLIFWLFILGIINNVQGQCPTVSPTGISGCRIAVGSVQLGALGSTGYYSWYNSSIGGNYLGSGNLFNTPSISTTTTYYVAAADTNYALNINGVNSYVNLGNPAQLQITGDLTIEMWIKPSNFSARRNPYAKAYGGEGTITQETNGTLSFYYGTSGANSSPYQGFGSGTSLILNQWNHIALVRDLTNMKLYWYINGVLTNQTNANYASATAGGNTAYIGKGYVSNYAGGIDEVRVWNTARTQVQIQNNKGLCLTGGEVGLAAYYPLSGGTGLPIAIDKTIFANNGTLVNINLATDWQIANYNYYCASCESPRTPVTATITPGTPVNLGNDTCLSGTKLLDAGAGFANYLWSTGATTQSITVNTTGTYWVTADNGGSCSSSDTINVTFITPPTAAGNCRIGAGSVKLTATGSTGSYNWYNSLTGGTLLASIDTFSTPFISSTTTYYVSSSKVNKNLDFDGINDYASLGNPTPLQITGNLTIEMWIKPSNFSARRNPYAKAYGGEGTITQETDGTLNFFYGTSGANTPPYQGFGSGVSLTLNQWNHIALVRDLTNMKLYWYINGVLTNQTNANYATATASGNTAYIGKGYVSNYAGGIDEVRVWNVARTSTQISANMSSCIPSNSTGLVAYYDMNEGSGSIINDQSSGITGNLINMNLATAWVNATNGVGCASCESTRVPVIATITPGTPVNLGNDTSFVCGNTAINLDAGVGYTNYLWSTGATTQSITVSTIGTYWVTAGNGGGCSSSDTIRVAQSGGALTALKFNGTSAYVSLGNPIPLQITGNLTIEMWIKPTNFSARRNPYAKAYGGEGTITQETNGTLNFYYGTSGANSSPYQGFGSGTSLILNQWNHIALVRDLTNMKLYWYINGVLTNQTNANYSSATASSNNAYIGKGYVSNYAGQIDEVRVWNTARTQTQIRNKMCSKLSGGEAGLAAYYTFNDGSGTSLTDTKNGANGTLVGMLASDWVTSGVAIGDKSAYLYPTNWVGQTVNLASCSGDNLTVSNVSAAVKGIHIYYVDGNPNSLAGISSFNTGNHYFGVFKTDNATATYTATYNYNGHPLVNTANKSGLVLLKRNDNTDPNWIDALATNNTTANTLTATSQNTEYIVDLQEYVWTGVVSTNWATAANWNPASVPPTKSNINIPNVTNQPVLDQNRIIGSLTLANLSTINLNGFELSLTKDFSNNGTVIPNSGTLTFAGTTNAQVIYANTKVDLSNLHINNLNGVTIANGVVNLSNTLNLMSGTFTTDDSLVLISNLLGTARVAPITSGNIVGKIVMQRYIPAGATNWRFLTSAVSGATLAQLNDNFVTSGFIGSDFPNWPSAANPWASIYFYNETKPGIRDSGFVAATNVTNPMGVGQGVWAWSGDTITGTLPFTVDVQGVANTGNINLPVSYTNTGSAVDDGWNMVGNPYPSAIDWNSTAITKTGINSAIYIWNTNLQQYASYVFGIGTNGGSNIIASSQAFWVQANATTANVLVTEASKTNLNGTFLKQSSGVHPLTINVQSNYGSDQTIINFENNATNGFDASFDALKMYSVNTDIPNISSINQNNNTEYSINQLPPEETNIYIKITTGKTGLHNINIAGVSNFANSSCLLLEDLFTGTIYDLNTTNTFIAYLYDTTTTARFLLKLGAIKSINTTNVSCFGNNDGVIRFAKNSVNNFDIVWKDNASNVITNNTNVVGSDSLLNVSAGTYFIETTDLTCGNSIDTVVVSEPLPITAQFFANQDTIYLSNGGNINFTNTSNNALNYNWDFGDGNNSTLISPTYQYILQGNYLVTLTASQSINCFKNYSKNITVLDVVATVNQVNLNNATKVWINNHQLIVKGNKINKVEVRNILGQLLLTSNRSNNKQIFDLSDYSSQVFIVTIFKSNNRSIFKVRFIQ